jgi:hypothetical protein
MHMRSTVALMGFAVFGLVSAAAAQQAPAVSSDLAASPAFATMAGQNYPPNTSVGAQLAGRKEDNSFGVHAASPNLGAAIAAAKPEDAPNGALNSSMPKASGSVAAQFSGNADVGAAMSAGAFGKPAGESDMVNSFSVAGSQTAPSAFLGFASQNEAPSAYGVNMEANSHKLGR